MAVWTSLSAPLDAVCNNPRMDSWGQSKISRGGSFCSVARLLAVVLLWGLAAGGARAGEPALPQAVGSDAACLMCHAPDEHSPLRAVYAGPHGAASDPRTPRAQGGCESCHGPSAAHLVVGADGVRPPPPVRFARGEAAGVQSAACLACHDDTGTLHWPGSRHAEAEVSCTACHRGHVARDTLSDALEQLAVCTGCHVDVRAALNRRSAHPLRDGQQRCTDCHAPHGSPGQGMLIRGTGNDTCYDCHAEKRGPFLWEHAPVGEDCGNCHVPHGSQHESLLTARTPWLCQQCHLAQFHPSTALTGTGIPPAGASSSMLLRDCMNCHAQVHGSNHPSGPGQIR